MEKFPDEVLLKIVAKCQPNSWMALQTTSKKLRKSVLEHEQTVEEIYVYDFFVLESDIELDEHLVQINPEKLSTFLVKQFTSLKHLGFVGVPMYLSWGDLVIFSQKLPALESLDLSQKFHQPKFGFNSFKALPYFRQLKCLILDGLPVDVGSSDNCHLELPPMHLMKNLYRFSINCKSGVIFRVMRALRKRSVTQMTQLRSIRAGGRQKVTVQQKDLEILIWFLECHRNQLVEVEICDFTFPAPQHVWAILEQCFKMPNLHHLSLEKCCCLTNNFVLSKIPILNFDCTQLRRLDLRGSNFYPDFFASFMKPHFPKLIIQSV